MEWLRETGDGVVLRLRVQPRAKRSGLGGVYGDRLRLRINAPPVDDKANQAVCDYLARVLGLPRSSVTLRSGRRCRDKDVRVADLDREAVLQRLRPHMGDR